MRRNTSTTQAINQAIISFVFGGESFNIDCHLEGIRGNTRMFNALESAKFYPLFDEQHNSFQFVPYEYWQRELPMFLKHQAS